MDLFRVFRFPRARFLGTLKPRIWSSSSIQQHHFVHFCNFYIMYGYEILQSSSRYFFWNVISIDNCQTEDSIQNTFVPPTTQSLKARTKHGLSSSSISNHTSNFTGGGNTGGGKRARTIFTTEQLERMEREFHKQQVMFNFNSPYDSFVH